MHILALVQGFWPGVFNRCLYQFFKALHDDRGLGPWLKVIEAFDCYFLGTGTVVAVPTFGDNRL